MAEAFTQSIEIVIELQTTESPLWSAERRRRARSQGCVPRLRARIIDLAPSRRSTPLIVGTEKEHEGRPGAQLHRDAERWLRGLSDIVDDTDIALAAERSATADRRSGSR